MDQCRSDALFFTHDVPSFRAALRNFTYRFSVSINWFKKQRHFPWNVGTDFWTVTLDSWTAVIMFLCCPCCVISCFCFLTDMDWSIWNKGQLFVSNDSIFIPFLLTQHTPLPKKNCCFGEKIIKDYRFPKLCPLINLNGWKYFQNVMDCFVWIFIWTKNEMPFARLIIVWYLQALLEAT